jgi:FixJ family two-component response regulator
MFSRPNGDLEKLLQKLPKLPTATLIERMQKVTDVNQRMYDLTEKERFNNSIIEFGYFVKKVIPNLKIMKKTIENFRGIKTSGIANNKILLNLLEKYEELNMNCYTENN